MNVFSRAVVRFCIPSLMDGYVALLVEETRELLTKEYWLGMTRNLPLEYSPFKVEGWMPWSDGRVRYASIS